MLGANTHQPPPRSLPSAADTRDWLSLSLLDIRQLFMDRGIDYDTPASDEELGRLLRLFAYALPAHIPVEDPGVQAAPGPQKRPCAFCLVAAVLLALQCAAPALVWCVRPRPVQGGHRDSRQFGVPQVCTCPR